MKLLFGAVVAVAGLWVLLRPQTWRIVFIGAAFVVGVATQLYRVTWEYQQRSQERPALSDEETIAALIDDIERDLRKRHRCP